MHVSSAMRSDAHELIRRRVVACAIAALAISAATPAAAFCRSTTCRGTDRECARDADGCYTEGAPLFWPSSCVSFAANELGTQFHDPAETIAIVRKTFYAWTDVVCASGGVASMSFEERDPVSCRKSEYNKTKPNLNVVVFQDDDWRYRGVDATLAKTSVTYSEQTGEIYDADIEINTAFNEVTISNEDVRYDLQAILTHEVGHFIGIAHSPDSTAVMFASYSPGSTAQRNLAPDDIDAVCSIYPPGRSAACAPEPRNGFSPTCDEEQVTTCSASIAGDGPVRAGSMLIPAAAAAALALGRALRRRRKGDGR